MVNYIRQYVWAHLPKSGEVTPKTRVTAALLWGLLFPLMLVMSFWFKQRDELEWFRGPLFVMLAGAVLGLLLLIPGFGGRVYVGILRVFSIVGFVIGNVGLTLIFFVIVTPTGWVLRLTGKDAMDTGFKKGKPPVWRKREGNLEPRRYYRLF